MAASRVQGKRLLLIIQLFILLFACCCNSTSIQQQQHKIQIDTSLNLNVPDIVIQSALVAISDKVDTDHSRQYYEQGELVLATESLDRSYTIFRLVFFLKPVCKNNNEETCQRESCTLDVQVNEGNVIHVLKDSIECKPLITTQVKKPDNTNERDIIENVEKQIVNQSNIGFDREVEMSSDHNDRPFVAVRATQSKYCPGCPFELNPRLSGLSAFGNQVLQSMDDAGISDFKHKLISIVRVTRAVPPSSNSVQYELLMEIGESNCLKSLLIEVSECPLQSNLPIKLCLVTFEEQPWLSNSRKITKNNCTELLNIDNEVNAKIDPNSSLKLESAVPYKDTTDDVSTKTEFYDQIAQEAQEVSRIPEMDLFTTEDSIKVMDTDSIVVKEPINTKTHIEKPEENNKPLKFTDKFKEFDEFLKDFDIPIKTGTTSPTYVGIPITEEWIVPERVEEKMTEDENSDKPSKSETTARIEEVNLYENPLTPTVESVRSKRSLKTLENSKMMQRKLAIAAIELLDELDDDDKRKHVIDITDFKRERQDHGIIYYMTVIVAPTDCSEKDNSTECLDEVIPGPNQKCKLDILTNEKKPLQSPKLLHYNCEENKLKSEMRFKRQVVGAPKPHSPEDPEVKKFVQLGLEEFSKNHYRGTNKPIATNIKDVSVQVVAGLLYKIRTDIGISTCNMQDTNDNCRELKADEKVNECIIEAWSKPWEGEPKITVKCGENKKRRKRSLRGQNYSGKMMEIGRELKEKRLFTEFISTYKKNYESDDERTYRFKIFRENLNMIEELQRNEQGTGRYGVTEFTDLTKSEFKKRYLGLKTKLQPSENDIPMPMAEIPDIKIPNEFDWRHYNVVTPVKNQGSCGSCWAFSVTGNVEGQYAIKHKKLLSLSEQELVDCDKIDEGCNGGLPDNAYRAIEKLGGLETESDYPYKGDNEKCHFNQNKVKVNVLSGLNITSNETQMAQWLVQNGPMSIGINANAMQFYMGGVSHPFKFLCSPDDLDHGVLIVGYGIRSYPIFKKKMPYWLIKNSWGPRWGEQGYYRIYRGDGACGVNKMVTSAVVA